MSEKQEMLTQEEVINVVQFATEMYSNSMTGYFNPFMSNQLLNNLNNNASTPTQDGLDKALKDYKNQAIALQSFSEFAEVYDKLYSRVIEHYANLLAFDLDIVPTNCKDPKELTSKEYLDDKRRVYKFLDNFDYKAEFKKVVKAMLRNEIYFTWLRDTQGTFDAQAIDVDNVKETRLSKYTLQTMPQARCLITGQWEYGLLYDFDMTYFVQAGIDINQYDPVFKSYLKAVFGGKGDTYIPTNEFNDRDGVYAQWTQTSPKDGAWCWKFDMTNMNSTPFLAGMIRNVLTNQEMLRLQSDANMLAAKGILAGELMMNDNKNNQDKDNTAFKGTTFKQFMKLVKAGLSENINPVALPARSIDFYQYENKNKDGYDNQLRTSAGVGASASRIIYSSDKMSQEEIRSAIQTDCNLMERVYAQFQNFLKYFVNKKTRKYKFDFIFSGFNHGFIRDRERDNLLRLADLGIVLHPTAYAKIVGMTPQAFERALEGGHYGGFTELLTPLISVHTNSGTAEKAVGAPKKETNELGDSGEVSQDYD